MNVYDFDGTIYNGDSSIRFYMYCIKKKPVVICCLPMQIIGLIRYIFKIDTIEQFKSKYFSFFRLIDVNLYAHAFWQKERYRIKSWYLIQKNSNDVIISASPEVLLKPICMELNVQLIGTKVGNSGRLLSKNCKGRNKVEFFYSKYSEKIDKFYSDSMSDIFLAKIAKEAYFVKKNTITKWK